MLIRSFFKKGQVLVTNTIHLQKNKVKKFFRKFYAEQHQLTSTTDFDRYPELFGEVGKYSKTFGDESLAILSYGCSTGEECVTLKSYFPKSRIIGVDINKSNIKKANLRNTHSDVKFILSTEENISLGGKYHLIFCLSVLCRWDDTKFVTNCAAIYPFKKFQETLIQLSNNLLPGGFLIIYNSNFRLEDTVLVGSFEIRTTPSVPDSGFVYKFDSQNNRLKEAHANCVYQKKTQ